MRDSMHLLDQLRERGYELQDREGMFDRYFEDGALRVILTEDAVNICAFDAPSLGLEWDASFRDGTPSSVILAALSAAEREVSGKQAL